MNILIEYQYFPNVTLFKILFKTKHIQFEQYETYQKASFRNRMVIASPLGPVNLSIPVLGGRNTRVPVNQVEIDYREPWQSHHLKTLKNYYNRSPWFNHYLPELEELYLHQQPRLLVNWNRLCFEWACRQLAIPAKITETDSYRKNVIGEEVLDLRGYFLPGNYSDPVKLAPFKPPVYCQVYEEKTGFLPNLSIADLIFCEGPAATGCFSTGNDIG